jgi:glycerate kinase
MVRQLDRYLVNYARVLKEDLDLDIDKLPGAGAAGGLGAGLMAFLGAELKSGVQIVIEASNLEEHLTGADLVITGEGKLDGQTAFGKAPLGVAGLAKKHGIPVVALAGALADDAHQVLDHGIDAIFSVLPYPMTLQEAMSRTDEFVTRATEQIVRLFLLKVDR